MYTWQGCHPKEKEMIFYSLPSDGSAICAVEKDGHMYEVRKNGYGGFSLLAMSDEEVKELATNMLELSQEEIAELPGDSNGNL